MPKRGRTGRRYWSAEVTRKSNALDLEAKVFQSRDPRRIAASLKRSAEASRRRKGTPYQSAMSMLTFYANRAGRNLSADGRRRLERAKGELRKLFGREPAGRTRHRTNRPVRAT
jgi:uncharacterized protein DUF3175